MAKIFVFLSENESQVLRTNCPIESAQIFAEWINSEPKAAREEGREAKREEGREAKSRITGTIKTSVLGRGNKCYLLGFCCYFFCL